MEAISTRKGHKNKSKKNRKFGRNSKTCERYRARKGLPLGPGVPGNKSGKNRRRKSEL